MAISNRIPHIALAHELIHGDRAQRGMVHCPLEIERHRIYAPALLPVRGWGTREELATIGIGSFHTPHCITENMIRAEQGMNIRVAYGITLGKPR